MSKRKYISRWRKFRPLAILLLALTGVGAPIATVLVTGADVAVEIAADE